MVKIKLFRENARILQVSRLLSKCNILYHTFVPPPLKKSKNKNNTTFPGCNVLLHCGLILSFLPPAAPAGEAKLLKKFDQNFLLLRIKGAHPLPLRRSRL